MRIFITSQTSDVNSKMDLRFGRCKFFHIYDTETKKSQVVENPAMNAAGGAGIQAANFVLDNNADVLITGHIGPNASMIINKTNIKTYSSVEKEISEIIEDYNNNKLSKIK